ncbi:hypothetical protein [Streptomyces sp. URMC 129]|uniref:hypothetical protein n=1 Tax=Streptomyces sp. URMC 129 TaxID=3423407 RepID=UPI003F1A90E9
MTNDDLTDLEREFGAMLRRTGNGFQHDAQHLVEGGMRRGRARLWRRRAGVLGGAVSAAAVAVAAVCLPGLGGDSQVTAAPPETGQDMIETLTAMLPDSFSVSEVQGAAGPATTPDPHVALVVDSQSSGSFTIELELTRWQTGDWRADAGCSTWDTEGGIACGETELADGSLLVSRSMEFTEDGMPVEDSAAGGPVADRSWGVGLAAPSGPEAAAEGFRSVSVTVSRSATEDSSDVPDEPPVDLSLLEEIIQDPVWQRVLDQVDTEYEAPEAFAGWTSSVESAELVAMFRDLAPSGLEIRETGDSYPGSAGIEVSDGRSTAGISINVYEPGSFSEADVPGADAVGGSGDGAVDDSDCETAATLPDGTTVLQCPQDAGSWMIDVYYPDGSSLDITQSAELSGEAEENDAPLSLEELTEIGSAPEWRTLFG